MKQIFLFLFIFLLTSCISGGAKQDQIKVIDRTIRLAYGYWKKTNDASPFSSQDISRFPDNGEGDALMVEIAKK